MQVIDSTRRSSSLERILTRLSRCSYTPASIWTTVTSWRFRLTSNVLMQMGRLSGSSTITSLRLSTPLRPSDSMEKEYSRTRLANNSLTPILTALRPSMINLAALSARNYNVPVPGISLRRVFYSIFAGNTPERPTNELRNTDSRFQFTTIIVG